MLWRIIENRNPPKIEPMVDGRSGFLFFDKDGSIGVEKDMIKVLFVCWGNI